MNTLRVNHLRSYILLLSFLFFALPFFAQKTTESEKITLPDVTTNIEGGSETIVPQALPDFSALIPDGASLLPTLPTIIIPPDTSINVQPAAQNTADENRIFIGGTLGGGYSGFFTGDVEIFKKKGQLPFALAFSHETANGYAQKSAASGFYDNRTGLRGNLLYTFSDTFSFSANALYEAAVNGMQGQSTFFYNTNTQFAGADLLFDWKFPRDFYLTAKADVHYFNRFNGFIAQTAPYSGLMESAYMSFSPHIKAGWNKNGINVYARADYNANWTISPLAGSVHRGQFTLGTDLTFAKLPDFKIGANISAAVSNVGNFTIPFALFVQAKIAPLTFYTEGGLRSALTNVPALFAEQPFAGFIVTPAEQSEWFASAKIAVPISIVSFGAQVDFAKTAFDNKKILPDYQTFDSLSGFFPLTLQDRTELNTVFSAGLQKGMFSVILGFKSQWLDKNPLAYNHALTAQASILSLKDVFGVTVDAEFGFSGDMMPILGLSGYYRISDTIRISAELCDIIKLCSGTGRIFVAPFIKRSGLAALKVKFLF